MKEKLKSFLSFILRIGFSVGLLWFVFSKIDMEKTGGIIKEAQLSTMFGAFALFFVINVFLLFRWNIFIRALGLQVKAFDVTRFFFVGLFGNLFLPSAIGGDLIKIVGLCKDSTQKPRVVASVLLDRLSGFASIVIVSTFFFIFGYRFIGDPSLIIPIALLAVGSLTIAAILFNEKIYSFGCRIFAFFPKFVESLMQLHYDISLMKDKKLEGWKAIGLSCLGQCTFAAVFYLIARALHQDVSFIYFLIFVPLICVASTVPSIGGLGVQEAGAAFLFTKVGVDAGVAVSISLVVFLFKVLVGLLGGAIYVSTLSSRRVQHHL